MKDFILRNSERVLALLLTGIFLALLYFGNQKGLHLWFESGRESGSLGLVTGIFIVFLLGLIAKSNFNILEKGDSLWLRKVRVHYKGRVVRTFYELADRY